jgi:hypothetical protein
MNTDVLRSSTVSSIPNLQQGTCLAKEVGDVGGETCGTARVGAGFAANNFSPVRAAVLILRRGVRGANPPASARSPITKAEPTQDFTQPIIDQHPLARSFDSGEYACAQD